MENLGYKPNFLGDDKIVELPTVSPQQLGNIVTNDSLRDGIILDYLNYSVVMNKQTRLALYSAGNADFKNNTGKGRNFRTDSRINFSEQLGNIYYKDLDGVENPYDRGHLIRRNAVAWGRSRKLANDASKDSCYFTNISLQHKNFNQDEWNALEIAIEQLNTDLDNKFNIFTGPIFTPMDRFIIPTPELEPARIPSGFWKIISYIGKDSSEVESEAFIVWQDDMAISAMNQIRGNREINPFEIYQTSTTMIENLTGLIFPFILFDSNPMFFFESETTHEREITTPQLNRITSGTVNNIIFSQ